MVGGSENKNKENDIIYNINCQNKDLSEQLKRSVKPRTGSLERLTG